MSIYGTQIRKYINDIKKEVFRKSIHICSSFIPFLLHLSKTPVIILLFCVLIFYIICEFLRRKGKSVWFISDITLAAARKRDNDKFVLGPVTLCAGIILTALFFEEIPCAIGIYSLAFGDGLASLFGKLFGRVKVPYSQGKTVAGSLTCFAAIFVSVFCVCQNSAEALLIAAVGMLIEVLPLKDFDNLLIPVIIAFIATYFHR
jgi:dolichol kinase